MLTRNVDFSIGLCNGTRLIVKEIGVNVIGATIVSGKYIREKVYIPRMNLIPTNVNASVVFQRR